MEVKRDQIPLNKVTWCFWEGRKTPLINACLESIKKHHHPCVVVDFDLLNEWGAHEVLRIIKPHKMDHKSDLIRLWLLKWFGGMWLDTDTICLKQVDALRIMHAENANAVIVCHRKTKKPMLPLAMRAGCEEVIWAFDLCVSLLKRKARGARQKNAATSVWILDKVRKKFDNSVVVLPHERYQRFFKAHREIYLKRSCDLEHEQRFPYNTCCHHLGACDSVLGFDAAELLGSDKYVSYLFRRALEREDTMSGVAAELLSRIPRHSKFSATQVGAMKDGHLVQLLNRRPNLSLTLFDQSSVEATAQSKLERADSEFVARALLPGNNTIAQSQLIEDRSQDLVFLEINDTSGVDANDLATWLPKVRPGGGIICGRNNGCEQPSAKAINQMANELGQKVTLGCDATWFVQLNGHGK